MKDKQYGINLSANIENFKKKMLEAKDITNSVTDAIKSKVKDPMEMAGNTSKKSFEQRLGTIGELRNKYEELIPLYLNVVSLEGRNSESANKLKEEMNSLTKQIEQEGEALGEVAEALDDVVQGEEGTEKKSFNLIAIFQNFEGSMKKSVNSIKRFTLSLLGVRSIYSILSKATNAYMSQNEEMHNRLQANWIALGSIIEPIVTRLIDLFTRLVGYINIFVKTFTGGKVDLIGKALDVVNKKSSKTKDSLSSMNKELASFDEITNINMSQGGGGGLDDSGVPGIDDYLKEMANMKLNPEIVKTIENFAKKLKEIWEWIKKNKELIKDLGIIIGVVFAGYKIGGFIENLSKMFGLVKTASGASGAFGLWGIAIAGIVADLYLAYQLGQKIVDLFEAREDQEQSEVALNDTRVKLFTTINEKMQEINEKQALLQEGSEEWNELESQKNTLLQETEEAVKRLNKDITEGKKFTKEQREEIDKQVKAIQSVSGKTFKTTIRADLSWSEKAKNFIRDNADILQIGANAIGAGTLFSFIRKHVGFAKGNVAYGPTFAEFGEYSGANTNPEITTPQNIMKETLFEALSEALPLMSQGTGQPQGDIVLNVNGREFARATYSDYQKEGQRMGSSNIAIRRG